LFRFGVDTSHVHFTGTSISAPHVAGAIALALEADPELTVGDIKTMISSVPTVDGNCFNAVEFMHLVASPDCRPGDADGSEMVDIDDIIFLINYIFGGAFSPYPYCCGDADGSCSIDVDDVVYTINYVFGGGPEPVPACYTCEYPVK
jgi:subtilisin family serine protease